LTEKEDGAMALKKAELAKFKERLELMRAKIQKMMKGTASEVITPDEATGYSQHQADEGTDEFDRTINLEISGNEREILQKINRALEKIEEGTYGTCDISGDEIPRARLEAVPYATMTVKAQEKYEKGLIDQ
jgi:DnaK suppressor protein